MVNPSQKKLMEMMIEFLTERTSHHNVGIYEMDNLIMYVGDINCGISIFRKREKTFEHYVATNIDAILEDDDAKAYEEVDTETLIDRLCQQDDDNI